MTSHRWNKSPFRISIGIAILLASTLIYSPTAGAFSYNRTAAVNYANTWSLSYNTVYPVFSSDDCANFVSQALTTGGVPWALGDGDWSNLSNWWDIPATSPSNVTLIYVLGNQNSNSASLAHGLYDYLNETGVGWQYGSFSYSSGNPAPSEPNSNIVPGDVFFYNFNGTGAGGISHSSFDVLTSGHDSLNPSFVGTLDDEHTGTSIIGRKGVFWTLKPEAVHDGDAWQYFTIWYDHIQA